VPVLIKNFQDKVGNRPNLDDSTGNEAGWRLVRRFFIFDTKSGVEGADNYRKGEVSTVIRYAKSITMRVTIDPANEEMIYTPLLIINYRERSKTGIASNPLTSVGYQTEYLQDNSSLIGTLKGLLVGALILLGILVLGQMIVWSFLPQISDDVQAQCQYRVVKFIMTVIHTFGSLIFWFLVILTGYWFIFFKLQERVFLLLPEVDHYSPIYYSFDVVFGLVCTTKLLSVLYKIYFDQCSFDIFLIDWEKPKKRRGYKNDI
jgi:meckelin